MPGAGCQQRMGSLKFQEFVSSTNAVGRTGAYRKPSSLSGETVEGLIHLGCSHPVLCAGCCKSWSAHRTECGEEVSECFGGEKERMSKSSGDVKESINKKNHNTTLKNLLEFSSAEMVQYIRVACQCDMQGDSTEGTEGSSLLP